MGQLLSFCFTFMMLICLTFEEPFNSYPPYLKRIKRQSRAPKTELTVTSFSIQSTIVSRYASTRVQTTMTNPHSEAKEAIFDLDLPTLAFISNFTMTINNKVYVAEVKEKHQAKKMYDEARRQGKTAAHVGIKDRETEKFRVSTSVEAGGTVTFMLSYEELLQRHLGKYQHAVSVRPQQVVTNLSVEVTISERTGIDYIHVLPLRTSRLLTNTLRGEADMPPSTKVEKGENCARIIFTPTPQEQAAYSSSGIMGDFVVQYDVSMKDIIGDVQIYNGYFVHYFAPRGLPPVQKNVVFVIDVSGSMFGTKMKQTKKAMHVILSDLHHDDYFNIVTFSDVVNVWKASGSIQATPPNIKSAKDYVNKMEADGWTDINAALLVAASVFNQSTSEMGRGKGLKKIPLIIFLTDGEATTGVMVASRILSNAKQSLKGNISLFGLAFGDDADYHLMRRLSLENRGVARRIYEDADATLQLKGFYDEIASPLLYDIELTYLDNSVQDVTQNLFPNYFSGSELVVAGKVKPGVQDLRVQMTAQNYKEQVVAGNDIATNSTEASFGCVEDLSQIEHFVQRLWAYFTIQDLLQARFKANDTATRRLLTEKATNLSLKYNFVTPVTSLIVVRPEEEEEKPQATAASGGTTSLPVTGTVPRDQAVSKSSPATSATVPTTKPNSSPKFTKPALKGTKINPSSTDLSSVTKAANPKGNAPSRKHPRTPAPHSPGASLWNNTRPSAQHNPRTPSRHNPGVSLLNSTQATAPPRPGPSVLNNPRTPAPHNPVASVLNTTRTPAHHNLPTPSHHNPGVSTFNGSRTPVPHSSGVSVLNNTQAPALHSFGTPTHHNPETPTHHLPGSVGHHNPRTTAAHQTPSPRVNTANNPVIPGLVTSLNLGKPTHMLNNPTIASPSMATRAEPRHHLPSQSTANHPSVTVLPVGDAQIEPSSFSPSTVPSSIASGSSLTHPNIVAHPEVNLRNSSGPPTLAPNSTSHATTESDNTPEGLSLVGSPAPSGAAGAISLVILPKESELLSATDVEARFVESLNTPAVYSFLTTDGDEIQDYDYSDFLGTSYKSPNIFTFSSSVDGDPHFVVKLPHSQESFCFTLDGRPGDILRLIGDATTGLRVNGHLVGAPPKVGHEDRPRTYFDMISIVIDYPRVSYGINVTRDSISLKGEGSLVVSWSRPAFIQKPQLALKVSPSANITLWIGTDVEFLILLHRYSHPTYLQLTHLGFYVVNGKGLSSSAEGLLGEFQHADIQVNREQGTRAQTGVLRSKAATVPVVWVEKLLKDSSSQPHKAHCWLVKRRDAEALLEGGYSSYLVSRLVGM
ncbi:inter-alpha-trypsin inhibitor heavy chain H6 isoform X2 [Tachyglossus aculeatus]|uniref:inter-alpha-trypsin inhibitor heavy chain H6 isoform X2 n=1 Tax=Tachyglossus aculeatus TaxID=9261 RepID=UPI0018F7B2C4|nr:inter-alpha-trypsin inhibitor heavy chain H6 isoform X2 [Tachyglossus aculeatus]